MAATSVAMFRGAASTTSATLYTVPSGKTAIVTNVVVANTAASAATFTLSLDGVVVLPTVSIAANSVATFDVKQVLAAGKSVSGFASAASTIWHISGVEVA